MRHRSALLTLLFEVDGRPVAQKITATPDGALHSTFRIGGGPGPVEFRCKRAGLAVTASAGTWDGDVLRVPATSAFTVTIAASRAEGAK
jgi:hypothetical protein